MKCTYLPDCFVHVFTIFFIFLIKAIAMHSAVFFAAVVADPSVFPLAVFTAIIVFAAEPQCLRRRSRFPKYYRQTTTKADTGNVFVADQRRDSKRFSFLVWPWGSHISYDQWGPFLGCDRQRYRGHSDRDGGYHARDQRKILHGAFTRFP